VDLRDLRSFLTQPLPPFDREGRPAAALQCYIGREAGTGFLGTSVAASHPTYSLYLAEGDRFLLAGRKRSGKSTSNYIISMDKRELARDSDSFLGKLRSNFVGTSFTVFDDGEAPEKVPAAAVATAPSGGGGTGANDCGVESVRKEVACIEYASNVLAGKGPRKMKVAIPRIAVESMAPVVYRPGK
jgi:hypothetical protein